MNWKFVIAIASMAVIPAANAGGTYTGMVRPLLYSNTLYLNISATEMSGRPACATRNVVRLREDPTDIVHKNKYALILASWFAEKPLRLSGDGVCTAEGDEIIGVIELP
jgi:hypothetical protein